MVHSLFLLGYKPVQSVTRQKKTKIYIYNICIYTHTQYMYICTIIYTHNMYIYTQYAYMHAIGVYLYTQYVYIYIHTICIYVHTQ